MSAFAILAAFDDANERFLFNFDGEVLLFYTHRDFIYTFGPFSSPTYLRLLSFVFFFFFLLFLSRRFKHGNRNVGGTSNCTLASITVNG